MLHAGADYSTERKGLVPGFGANGCDPSLGMGAKTVHGFTGPYNEPSAEAVEVISNFTFYFYNPQRNSTCCFVTITVPGIFSRLFP